MVETSVVQFEVKNRQILERTKNVVVIIPYRRFGTTYTASGIITPIGGRPLHRLRDDWMGWNAFHPVSGCVGMYRFEVF